MLSNFETLSEVGTKHTVLNVKKKKTTQSVQVSRRGISKGQREKEGGRHETFPWEFKKFVWGE